MKITKMALGKSVLAAMFLMMTFAYSLNVQAQDQIIRCNNKNISMQNDLWSTNMSVQSEIVKYCSYEDGEFSGGDGEYVRELISYIRLDGLDCASPSVIDDYHSMKKGNMQVRDWRPLKNQDAKCVNYVTQALGINGGSKQAKNNSNQSNQTQSAQSSNNSAQTTSNTDTSNNPKPLTKAELKAQKAEQAAQAAEQDVQQDTQLAQENQAKANKARQGKRRRHEPENEAHNCIKPDFGGLYGGMENTCNFKVSYTYCGYHPNEKSWLTGMACEKQSFGAGFVSPGRQDAAHTHGVEKLYWFACKDPAWPVDVEFVDGDIKGRCHTVGGGSD